VKRDEALTLAYWLFVTGVGLFVYSGLLWLGGIL
jgi:hypothetical protein